MIRCLLFGHVKRSPQGAQKFSLIQVNDQGSGETWRVDLCARCGLVFGCVESPRLLDDVRVGTVSKFTAAGLVLLLAFGLASAGCATIPSEAQRVALLRCVAHLEVYGERPGSRNELEIARMRAERDRVVATVNSLCLGEEIVELPVPGRLP